MRDESAATNDDAGYVEWIFQWAINRQKERAEEEKDPKILALVELGGDFTSGRIRQYLDEEDEKERLSSASDRV